LNVVKVFICNTDGLIITGSRERAEYFVVNPGKTSHFNFGTVTHVLKFDLMEVFILAFTITNYICLHRFLFVKEILNHEGYVWGIKLSPYVYAN